MLRLWRREAKQLDTVLVTYIFIDMSQSMYIPRSRTYFAGEQTQSISLTNACLIASHMQTDIGVTRWRYG